jgi:hypothetical protein
MHTMLTHNTLHSDKRTMSSRSSIVKSDRKQFATALVKPLCLNRTCGKGGNKACTSCHWAYYCSRECQKNDWVEHRIMCRECAVPEIEIVRKGFKEALLSLCKTLKGITKELKDMAMKLEGCPHPNAKRAYRAIWDTLEHRLDEMAMQKFLMNVEYTLHTKTEVKDMKLIEMESHIEADIRMYFEKLLEAKRMHADYFWDRIVRMEKLRGKHNICSNNINSTSVIGVTTIDTMLISHEKHTFLARSLVEDMP